MLILRRKDQEWIHVAHRSGDVMRIRVSDLRSGREASCRLGFEDDAHNFRILRAELLAAEPPAPMDPTCASP